eukprot:scaffold194495_cov14-Tisochrysis_lutea.AAC.1
MAQCPDKRLSVLTQQSRWFHLHQGKQTTPGSPTHSLRMAASVNWGYPKSMTSSSSSYAITKLSRKDSSSRFCTCGVPRCSGWAS